MDYAYRETEKALRDLEKKLAVIYEQASKELQGIIDGYFGNLVARDEHQRELMESGQITKEQYQLWRMAQIGRGERYIALQEEIARRCNQANQVAMSYINDTTPGIYSLNYNYSAYTIEKVHGNVGFTLFDEQAVRRLLAEDPELLPAPRIDIPLDLKWNRQKLQRELVTGIMLGESTGKLADRFQSITDMNRASALRNARTALTGAQNAGKQESMVRAKEMGIKLRKRWVAVKDGRTRHSHGMLDGQIVEVDEFFVTENGSKMMYPGDRNHGAAPCDIYNCRCGMRTAEKEGIEAELRQMRARDPVTGKNELISEMTYQEWYDWKRNQDPEAFDIAIKKRQNRITDEKQYEKYQNVLKENSPKTFAEFQEVKYNNTELWSTLKYQYRTVNRYEVEGTVSVSKILELDNAAWNTKQSGFDYSRYSGRRREKVKALRKSGNAAVLEFDGNTYFAHSRAAFPGEPEFDSYVGKYQLIGLLNSPHYEVLDLGDGIKRENDTEAKFFEFIAQQINPDAKITITILSEKHICRSCQHVMSQFVQEFPNVTVNVVSGKRDYNKSEEGLKTWLHRKK